MGKAHFSAQRAKECLRRLLQEAAYVPKFPQKLPGELWGITTYFNLGADPKRLRNYRIFRERSRAQGLKLLAVELALPGQAFDLGANDADKILQLRGGDVMWQKERLLNLGLEHLPVDCDKVAWLDADIVFLNGRWVEETRRRLETYVAVQPFQTVLWAGPTLTERVETRDGASPEGGDAILRVFAGAGQVMRKNFLGLSPGKVLVSHGKPGFGFAARRNVLAGTGFYDRTILGSGDSILAQAFFGPFSGKTLSYYERQGFFTSKQIKDFSPWAAKVFSLVRRSVFSVPGSIYHLWHGPHESRRYVERNQILYDFDFEPQKDIRKDAQGAWVWATEKKRFHQTVKEYFKSRARETEPLALRADHGKTPAS